MKRQLAKKIDKFDLGGTPNMNTVYINNLTKILNNSAGINQLSQAEYGTDMQFGDPTKPKKPQPVKPVQPYYTSDPKEFAYRNKMYGDSLSLYNQSEINKKKFYKDSYDIKSKKNPTDSYSLNHFYQKSPNSYALEGSFDKLTGSGSYLNDIYIPNKDYVKQQISKNHKTIKPTGFHNSILLSHDGTRKITPGANYLEYKKPTQPVNFVPKKDKPNTSFGDMAYPIFKKSVIHNIYQPLIEEVTPLKRMSFPQVARPELQIIPAAPYVKPVHYAGPRFGTWSDGSKGQFPQGLNTSDWERKTKEYQEQQRGVQPVVQTRKEGGEPDGTLPDEEWYKKYQQQKAKYESDKAKGIISSTGYLPEVTVTPANNNRPKGIQVTPEQYKELEQKSAGEKWSKQFLHSYSSPKETPWNYTPQSAGSADWFWTLPFAAPAAIEAAGAIGAMSLPGMAAVPGATVGNAAMAAGMANSFYQTPKNVRDWYDVSQGNKDWKEAAAGTAEIAAGLIGSKAGFKSVADDVVQGAKTVGNLPTKVSSASNSFLESEINWGNWNKEILADEPLLKEYAEIEKTAKANGTWMKNSDGSKFVGTKPTQKELDFHGVSMTPEEAIKAQFVQQNSKNIPKNIIKNKKDVIQNNYHNSDAKFDFFSEEKFGTNADDGWYGKGNYTSPDSKYTKPYGENRYDLYASSENPGIITKKNIDAARHYNRTSDEIATNIGYDKADLVNRANNNKLASFMRSGVTEIPSILKNGFTKYYDILYEQSLQKALKTKGSLDNFTSLHNPYNKETVTPFSNYLKSAIGNNGKFDMTNPNIYKAAIPLTIGTGVALDQWHLQPATIEGGFKYGGAVESWEDDLDDTQIKAYRKAGYIVKVIK